MTRTLSRPGKKRPTRWGPKTRREFAKRLRRGQIKGLRLTEDGHMVVVSPDNILEMKSRKCSPRLRKVVGALRREGQPEKGAYNVHRLGRWIVKHGKKARKKKRRRR